MEIKWIHDSLHHFAYIDDPKTSEFAAIIVKDDNMYYWDIKKRSDYHPIKLLKSGGNKSLEVCMRNVIDNLQQRFQLV